MSHQLRSSLAAGGQSIIQDLKTANRDAYPLVVETPYLDLLPRVSCPGRPYAALNSDPFITSVGEGQILIPA